MKLILHDFHVEWSYLYIWLLLLPGTSSNILWNYPCWTAKRGGWMQNGIKYPLFSPGIPTETYYRTIGCWRIQFIQYHRCLRWNTNGSSGTAHLTFLIKAARVRLYRPSKWHTYINWGTHRGKRIHSFPLRFVPTKNTFVTCLRINKTTVIPVNRSCVSVSFVVETHRLPVSISARKRAPKGSAGLFECFSACLQYSITAWFGASGTTDKLYTDTRVAVTRFNEISIKIIDLKTCLSEWKLKFNLLFSCWNYSNLIRQRKTRVLTRLTYDTSRYSMRLQ